MSKRVVIISSSLRKNSNSESLATAFAQGAKAAGHAVEQITLRDKVLGFCEGCFTGNYPAQTTKITLEGKERGGMEYGDKCLGADS